MLFCLEFIFFLFSLQYHVIGVAMSISRIWFLNATWVSIDASPYTSLTFQFPQWWGPKTISTPYHSTGMKVLVPISFLSLYLQFQDADLGFPLIVLVSAGVWQGQLIWLWWGPDLSWAVFIFDKLWSWLPGTLGKHSFVLPPFTSLARGGFSCFLSSLSLYICFNHKHWPLSFPGEMVAL